MPQRRVGDRPGRPPRHAPTGNSLDRPHEVLENQHLDPDGAERRTATVANDPHLDLSRRERQVMEILWRLGRASAAQVRAALADPPSYSAVRAALRLLVEKGHARHEKDGRQYVYAPTADPGRVRRSVVTNLLRTFFAGSVERAVASMLDVSARDLTAEEFTRLKRLIEDARAKGGAS